MSEELLKKLVEFETSLHKQTIRNDRTKLEELLHQEFFEFGSSGKIWSRQETIEALISQTDGDEILSENYRLRLLAEELAQLTYVSKRADGSKALRCSLWKREDGSWKMIFHQGTKTHF